MKILITGGAGFIGSALIRHLLENTNYDVVNLDAITYAGNLESVPKKLQTNRYSFCHVDLCDADATRQAVMQVNPTVIMHLAAESHVDRSIDGPSDFIQTNIVGTYNLLEAARGYWAQLSKEQQSLFRFHHISTDEVYGDLHGTANLFTEETSYDPSSPYSASKAASDHLVRAWHRTYGLPVLITNCSNNYGPYHFPEKLIPHMILNAVYGKVLPVYGDGKQIRDWLYVEDHARALYKVVTEGAVGETYNIGGFNEKQNIEVVNAICSILTEELDARDWQLADGEKIQPVAGGFESLITYVKDRPGHDVRYAIDARKLERELGWHPAETFDTGIRNTIAWYLDNPGWWKRVLSGEYRMGRLGDN